MGKHFPYSESWLETIHSFSVFVLIPHGVLITFGSRDLSVCLLGISDHRPGALIFSNTKKDQKWYFYVE